MPEAADITMLKRLSALAGLFLFMVAARLICDTLGIKVPWYLLHEVTLLLVPMMWLLFEVYPKLLPTQRIAFVITSGFFISMSAIAELLAIEHRYWSFYTDIDPLSGLDLGGIPLEEFLSYPLLLNIPILWYLWLRRVFEENQCLSEVCAANVSKWLARAAYASLLGAVILIALAVLGVGNVVPMNAQPRFDAMGAIRFAAGPHQFGWTIVQLLGWAGTFAVGSKIVDRLEWKPLLALVLTYFPFALFFELLACGRGWWVWNIQQTLGITVWVLPIESFSMYLTGALFPTLCFVWLESMYQALKTSPCQN